MEHLIAVVVGLLALTVGIAWAGTFFVSWTGRK